MRKILIALLTLAIAGLAGATTVMYLNLGTLREGQAAGVEAMAAAKALAPDLLSYNYRTIEQDLARAGEHTTGELTQHYKDLATTLVTKAKDQKMIQQAAVAGAAVERAAANRVEILLFVNMGTIKEIPGEAELQQQFSKSRARFVMVRTAGRWLVSDLSTLIGKA